MRHFITAILALFTLTAVSACGFTPLYAGSSNSAGLVTVDEIEGRAGHALRKALIEQLAIGLPGLEEPATLTIVLETDLKRLALQPDEAASRTDIMGEAQYVLATADNAISGKVEAETSFNVPNEPFADVTAQIDASDRAMTLLARRIVDDLRITLAQQR
jgi:LPS-assembly lipoprotein